MPQCLRMQIPSSVSQKPMHKQNNKLSLKIMLIYCSFLLSSWFSNPRTQTNTSMLEWRRRTSAKKTKINTLNVSHQISSCAVIKKCIFHFLHWHQPCNGSNFFVQSESGKFISNNLSHSVILIFIFAFLTFSPITSDSLCVFTLKAKDVCKW